MNRLTISTLLCLLSIAAFTQVPQLLNFQGKLTNADGTVETGTTAKTITFSIYSTESGGQAVWTETQSVTVTDGVFNVLLGSVNAFSETVFTGSEARYLGIKVGDEQEMIPRFRITSVAYAIQATKANTIVDGAVTAESLSDNAVTSQKIQDGQVKEADIANDAVSASKIKNAAVETDAIRDGAVTYHKQTITTYQANDADYKSHRGMNESVISEFSFSNVPAGDVFVILTCFAESVEGIDKNGRLDLDISGNRVNNVPTHGLQPWEKKQLTLHGRLSGFAGGRLIIRLIANGESSETSFHLGVQDDGRFGRWITVMAGL